MTSPYDDDASPIDLDSIDLDAAEPVAAPGVGLVAEDGELPPLSAVVEALLLVTDEPVPAATLAQVAERPTEQVERVLRDLVVDYATAGRGFELAGGSTLGQTALPTSSGSSLTASRLGSPRRPSRPSP